MTVVHPARVRPVALTAVSAELARSGALRRVVRWQPALAAWVLGGGLLLRGAGGVHDEAGAVGLLRAVGVVLALGTLFVLDDATRMFSEPTQPMARFRLAVRLSIALSFAGIGFAAAALALRANLDTIAVWGVALELVATILLGLTVAALAVRWYCVDEPGVLTAPVVVAGFMAIQFLPQRWSLLTGPGPEWGAAHARWAVLLVLATTCLALAGRDLAARRRSLLA